MKMKKFWLGTMVIAAGLCFGAANDTVLVFSTQGPDTYGDGTQVLDGECYALVWIKNGTTFAGLTSEGKSLAETTKIVAVAPLAKAGHCPKTVFEIDADYAAEFAGGSFALYLLDTRVSANALAKTEQGKPTVVNAVGSSSANNASGTIATCQGGTIALAKVGVYSEIEAPKIAAMKVDGAKITLSVAGMSAAADYFVVPGAALGEFKPALATKPENGTFTFEAPKDATFFKVIGVRKFK